MKQRTTEQWKGLSNLPALLNELPVLVEELGFRYYSFSFVSPDHEVNSGNLQPGGQTLIQTVLDSCPARHQRPALPIPWSADLFCTTPQLWAQAQTLGLCHGWIQPTYLGATHSSLTLLRPYDGISLAECYAKTAAVMWLAERLHLAATQAETSLTSTHDTCAHSRKA